MKLILAVLKEGSKSALTASFKVCFLFHTRTFKNNIEKLVKLERKQCNYSEKSEDCILINPTPPKKLGKFSWNFTIFLNS
jgi:hypothetical protein